jgi:hypothetical protein
VRHRRIIEHRRTHEDLAVGTDQHRATRERLAALESDQLCQCDEDPVLHRAVAGDLLPACEGIRLAGMQRIGRDPARGARGHHRNQLGAVNRRDGRRDRMPDVLAHQHRRPAESCREGTHVPPGIDEAFLVEHSIGGKKDLAMHMPNPGVAPAEGSPHGGVVVAVVAPLVEAETDLQRGCLRPGVPHGQFCEERRGLQRMFPDATLEEVPRHDGLGKHRSVAPETPPRCERAARSGQDSRRVRPWSAGTGTGPV